MKAEDLLEARRQQWNQLEVYVQELGSTATLRSWSGEKVLEFSQLYRSACSDLALANAYRLPPQSVEYLHNLVGRAHNQLYRSRKFQVSTWIDMVFKDAPKQIFRDRCVHVASILFFGLFFLSACLAWNNVQFPDYATKVLGDQQIAQLESNFAEEIGSSGSLTQYVSMAAFYIWNNAGIGLKCFALGPLLIPGLFTLAHNAVVLGASFGYMARDDVDAGKNFFEFVTAHGPFELTAIVLAAAAGLRLGVGLFFTNGMTRITSLQVQASQALPVIIAASVLFVLAAFTEGFISPSPLPYTLKALWAVLSSTSLMFYFVVLGAPSEDNE
jgi:uncharacterized membrane protein SpoIIM required for sporulation